MSPRRTTTLLAAMSLAGTVVWTAAPAHTATAGRTQTDDQFAASYTTAHVRSVEATAAAVSCYRPEVPYSANLGPVDGYSGESACPGATTGEDVGATPYATQAGSNPGYPAAGPMLVKDHSESDIRVDPTNPRHLIGTSKWIVSAEGYNHLLGFFESFDGGRTWPVQGHMPGYEGWTDNTDPVGAFDAYGNFYSLDLPYQFFYRADGSHDFSVGVSQEPNPAQPSQAISIQVRPHGATSATDWRTTVNGHPDFIATYDSIGNAPDKQWITIDTNPASPFFNRVYAMWVDFHDLVPVPYVSFAQALPDGTHTPWSAPRPLPEPPHTPQGATYLLPHVTPDGNVYTTLTNSDPAHQFAVTTVFADVSTDGGATWSVAGTPVPSATAAMGYANTTFRSGIEDTFTTGDKRVNGHYPLYVAYEDVNSGFANSMLTASYDGGATWTAPVRVNDNAAPADEFQPNLAAAPDGTVSVAFYDRRLACPTAGSAEAAAAGLALDTVNPDYSGALPPYGVTNYCVNTAIQFYDATLKPLGNNIRLSPHAYDPQLNSPHSSSASSSTTFLGDYFGNTTGPSGTGGYTDYTTSVTTYNDGTNPANRQQQLVSAVAVP
ncbi:MAG: hypothetical protein HOV83_06765 [Catenulispora sp.]|nr:hypothetical protein [Catenulispora sp.]